MTIPKSMIEELSLWNNGKGIDLESWVGCEGSFSLAVGYTSIFCPNFVEYGGYIFQAEEVDENLISAVKRWESSNGTTRQGVEWVINHLHISDIQHNACEDISKDKLLVIGRALKKIYEAMLSFQFPERPCVVEFQIPEDEDNLDSYQISFWQKKHEQGSA